MPISCVDGDITDHDLARWEVPPLRTSLALTCEQVRAVFEGSSLSRGIALLSITQVQFEKLFPTRSRRKNAYNLRRWAARVRGERARKALARASWEQLRAAAAHDDEDAQIVAAMSYALGMGRRSRSSS